MSVVESDDESDVVTEGTRLSKERQELSDDEEFREYRLWKQMKDREKRNPNFSRQQETANKLSKPKAGFGV